MNTRLIASGALASVLAMGALSAAAQSTDSKEKEKCFGIAKAGSTDTEAMADGFGGAKFATPFGPVTWRAIDHQATFGAFIGRTALKNGRGTMVDWRYVDGADALPPDSEIKALRPG